MEDSLTDLTIALAALALTGAFCQWLAWHSRLPAILFLLITGIMVGPLTGWFNPDDAFGDLLFPFVSLSVAVILFEGALSLKFREIRGLETVVRRFVTTGPLITWAVAAVAAHLLVGFDWALATLFGAIMVVTGPTVIVPMLRSVRPTVRIARILRWEGIVIDPIGALLAVLVYEFIVLSEAGTALAPTLGVFALTVATGSAFGLAGGAALAETLRRDWIPGYLFNIVTLSTVFGVFAFSNAIAEESGLLAVTVMGMMLANRKGVPIEEILAFKESLSLLLITALFVLLAARLDVGQLQTLGLGVVGVFLCIQLVARPLEVLFCTRGSSLRWGERGVLAWIAPRGIVAAAVSALFAFKLEQLGHGDASLLVPLTFAVIIGTVMLQSLTAGWLARTLGATEPDADGFLILGANPFARAIARALQAQGLRVLLCDTLWDNVSRARMAGLPAYYGSPVSEHAELYLDTSGLGTLLAVTADHHLNTLACERFSSVFGARRVFAVRVGGSDGRNTRAQLNSRGRNAFGSHAGYVELSRKSYQGAEIRRTTLSESFDMFAFRAMHGSRATLLFAIDPKGRLEVFGDDQGLEPTAGWSVLALIEPAAPINEPTLSTV